MILLCCWIKRKQKGNSAQAWKFYPEMHILGSGVTFKRLNYQIKPASRKRYKRVGCKNIDMAKTKSMTKANKVKLNKVAQVLQTFAANNIANTAVAGSTVIPITDIYTVGNSGATVSFDLVFRTKGVGALTDAVINNVTPPDKVIVAGGKDSLLKMPLGTDKDLNGTILKIKSVVTATNLTPVPTALETDLSLTGGQAIKTFPLPPGQFTNVGDSFILDFTIIIFQA